MAIKAKKVKFTPRERRKMRIRQHISGSDMRPRVSIFRSAKYTYAQVISDESNRTLVSGSTRDAAVLKAIGTVKTDGIASSARSAKSVVAAKALGFVLAGRMKEQNIANVVFDRNGFVFMGRTRALADGMKEAGIKV